MILEVATSEVCRVTRQLAIQEPVVQAPVLAWQAWDAERANGSV